MLVLQGRAECGQHPPGDPKASALDLGNFQSTSPNVFGLPAPHSSGSNPLGRCILGRLAARVAKLDGSTRASSCKIGLRTALQRHAHGHRGL